MFMLLCHAATIVHFAVEEELPEGSGNGRMIGDLYGGKEKVRWVEVMEVSARVQNQG